MSEKEIEEVKLKIKDEVEKELANKKFIGKEELERLEHKLMHIFEESKPKGEGKPHNITIPAYVKSAKCKDCGTVELNPHYVEAEYYCKGCGHPYGTQEQAEDADKCPNCGSKEAALHIPREEED